MNVPVWNALIDYLTDSSQTDLKYGMNVEALALRGPAVSVDA